MEERKEPLVVALDGPAGVGKSTVAMALAAALGLQYVETGALYRAVGLAALRMGVSLDDALGLERIAAALDVVFRMEGGVNRVFLTGEDVTLALRAPNMGPVASKVSACPEVRQALLPVQRRFAQNLPGAVAEGRDIGTVVFPNASYKFFLTADVKRRAGRRHLQLMQQGKNVAVEELEVEIAGRDKADSGRKVAPLKAAADAVIVDTSELTAQQVVDGILRRIRSKAQ